MAVSAISISDFQPRAVVFDLGSKLKDSYALLHSDLHKSFEAIEDTVPRTLSDSSLIERINHTIQNAIEIMLTTGVASDSISSPSTLHEYKSNVLKTKKSAMEISQVDGNKTQKVEYNHL